MSYPQDGLKIPSAEVISSGLDFTKQRPLLLFLQSQWDSRYFYSVSRTYRLCISKPILKLSFKLVFSCATLSVDTHCPIGLSKRSASRSYMEMPWQLKLRLLFSKRDNLNFFQFSSQLLFQPLEKVFCVEPFPDVIWKSPLKLYGLLKKVYDSNVSFF